MPVTPTMDRVLSRADPVVPPAFMPITGDHSAAMLGYFADFGRFPDACVLFADPVHLRADKSCVRLFGVAELAVTNDEATALVAAFNGLYRADGIRLEMATPERWYLHLNQAPAPSFTPTTQLIGQDIDPHLPRGDDAKRWHALMNEWQMLFFGHPVNQARTQHRQPMINGVWIWGEGTPAMRPPADTEQVWSDDPVAQGVAAEAGLVKHGKPTTASDWLAQGTPGSHWIDIPDLQQASGMRDAEAWSSYIERLETEWLAPLYDAVINRKINLLTITTDNDMAWQFRANHRLRFWRRGSAIPGKVRHG